MDRMKGKHQEFLELFDLFLLISFALKVSHGMLCLEVILYPQENMT